MNPPRTATKVGLSLIIAVVTGCGLFGRDEPDFESIITTARLEKAIHQAAQVGTARVTQREIGDAAFTGDDAEPSWKVDLTFTVTFPDTLFGQPDKDRRFGKALLVPVNVTPGTSITLHGTAAVTQYEGEWRTLPPALESASGNRINNHQGFTRSEFRENLSVDGEPPSSIPTRGSQGAGNIEAAPGVALRVLPCRFFPTAGLSKSDRRQAPPHGPDGESGRYAAWRTDGTNRLPGSSRGRYYGSSCSRWLPSSGRTQLHAENSSYKGAERQARILVRR